MMRSEKILILLLSSVVLFGGTDGTIRGKITDVDGVPLVGSNIILPSLGIGAAADMDGNYIILNVPIGDYDVVVQMIGYKKTYSLKFF